MAYTQQDIDDLKAAIATGARDVSQGAERVAYRTLPEMREALALMEAEVNGVAPAAARQRTLRPRTTRGFS